MKTLILTLASTVFAAIFSSCCCSNTNSQLEVKHYDSRGRLVKDIHADGNYTTYHYDGTSPDGVNLRGPRSVAPQQTYSAPNYDAKVVTPKVRTNPASYDSSWKPRIP